MQVWVIDTSSVIELRQIPHEHREQVMTALDEMVENDLLFYPPEVLGELKRTAMNSDVASTWAKKNAAKATRYRHLLEKVKMVLARLPNLIDPDKVSDVDFADPHVIALAQGLAENGHTPTVITNDTKSTPKKTALSAGAGVFGFPSVPLLLFLQTQNIYPRV